MVSSKFGGRAKIRGRPKICKPPPPPPPLIPPPPPWPPASFSLHYVADFEPPPGPIHVDRTFTLQRGEWTWTDYIDDPPDHYSATWILHPSTQTADLYIDGSQSGEGWHSNAYDIPVAWGSPHIYVIDEWDDYDPYDLTAKADFLF